MGLEHTKTDQTVRKTDLEHTKTDQRVRKTDLKHIENLFESKLNNPESIAIQEYLDGYTFVYDYCTGSRENDIVHGEDLYVRIRKLVTQHVEAIGNMLSKREKREKLDQYCFQWMKYQKSALWIDKMGEYLNRYWIKQTSMENGDIYCIHKLCLVIWSNVLSCQMDGLAETALELIDRFRVDQSTILCERSWELPKAPSSESLEITKILVSSIHILDENTQGSQLFQRMFQEPFLNETIRYYQTWMENCFKRRTSISDYCILVTRVLEMELSMGLELGIQEIEHALILVLIIGHLNEMVENFAQIVDQDPFVGGRVIYNLLNRAKHTHAEISVDCIFESFESLVFDHGKTIINQNTTGLELVGNINNLYTHFTEICVQSFSNNGDFLNSRDKGFRKFIGLMESIPKILVDCISHGSDETARISADEIMTVFRYIEDKDVFQNHYTKELGRRLIISRTISSTDWVLLDKLEEMCGGEYTRKMRNMCMDMEINRVINEEYQKLVNDDVFSTLVLDSKSWPFSGIKRTEQLPLAIQIHQHRFSSYYGTKHPEHSLFWTMELSHGEIEATFRRNGQVERFLLVCSGIQMEILFLVQSCSMALDQLASRLGVPPEFAESSVALLAQRGLLRIETSENLSTIQINNQYMSDQTRVECFSRNEFCIDQTIEKSEAGFIDQMGLIQSTIMKILKHTQAMDMGRLISEVLQNHSIELGEYESDRVRDAMRMLVEKGFVEINGQSVRYIP